MILIYNSYVPPGYNYRRVVDDRDAAGRSISPAVKFPGRSSKGKTPQSSKSQPAPSGLKGPSPARKSPGISGSILPAGIDTGDILLTAVLFLLYIESKDEDFLIILAVMALSILKPQED